MDQAVDEVLESLVDEVLESLKSRTCFIVTFPTPKVSLIPLRYLCCAWYTARTAGREQAHAQGSNL